LHVRIGKFMKFAVLVLMAVMLEAVSTSAQAQQNSASRAFAVDPANFVQHSRLLPSAAFPALRPSIALKAPELNLPRTGSFAGPVARSPLPASPRPSPSGGGRHVLAKTAIVLGAAAIGVGAASLAYSHSSMCPDSSRSQGGCHAFNTTGEILLPVGAVSVVAGIIELRH
jgi:hypothetical protein